MEYEEMLVEATSPPPRKSDLVRPLAIMSWNFQGYCSVF